MTFFRRLGKTAYMSSEIKQALKQLRKAWKEQRAYEMFLRSESAQRLDILMEKLLPLVPLLMSKFSSSTNGPPSEQASQILLLTQLVCSLTDAQITAIQEHLSVEQKKHLLDLLRSITRGPHTASSSPSQKEEPAADPPKVPIRHWLYPSMTVGCGLNMDDLRVAELTCLRGEVTCAGCLAQLRADQEKNSTDTD